MAATPIPQELTNAWQLALEFWNQPARHDALLGVAAKHQQFAWLAGKYRDAARSNPADPVAADRLLRVRRAAAIVMMATSAPPPPKSKAYRGAAMMLVGAMLAAGLGLFITEQKVQQHQTQRTMVTRHP